MKINTAKYRLGARPTAQDWEKTVYNNALDTYRFAIEELGKSENDALDYMMDKSCASQSIFDRVISNYHAGEAHYGTI